MRPYFEFCIEKFGAGRCMFESNFPVDRVSYSYVSVWNAFKIMSRGYSDTERDGAVPRHRRTGLPAGVIVSLDFARLRLS